jgi:hypothetical protein
MHGDKNLNVSIKKYFLIIIICICKSSLIISKEKNNYIYINKFSSSPSVSKSESQKIENAFMNRLLNQVGINKIDLVIYDYSNLEESINRSVFNSKMGKDFQSDKLQLDYKFSIQGRLNKQDGKYILFLDMSDGKIVSQKLKSVAVEFYDYQLNYYMDEVSKYLLIHGYMINDGNKPVPPEINTKIEKIKIPYSESKMNIVKTSLSKRDSLFIVELEKALILGDEEFKNQNYYKAYEYYNNIEKWISGKDYNTVDNKILVSLKNITSEKIQSSLYNHFISIFLELIKSSESNISEFESEKIANIYKEFRKLHFEVKQSNLENRTILTDIAKYSDSILEVIIFKNENNATNLYNELKFRESIKLYNETKDKFVFYDEPKEATKNKRIKEKIKIVEKSMIERHKNYVFSKILTSYDLANRYEVLKDINKIQNQNISEETLKLKKDSLKNLKQAEEEIKNNYDIEEDYLISQFNNYKQSICKSLQEECEVLRPYKELQVDHVNNLRNFNFVLPGSYNILYGDRYESESTQKTHLTTAGFFYLSLYLMADSYNKFRLNSKKYQDLNNLATVNYAINDLDIQRSLAGILFINNQSREIKNEANVNGNKATFFLLFGAFFYYLDNNWTGEYINFEKYSSIRFDQELRIHKDSSSVNSLESIYKLFFEVKF